MFYVGYKFDLDTTFNWLWLMLGFPWGTWRKQELFALLYRKLGYYEVLYYDWERNCMEIKIQEFSIPSMLKFGGEVNLGRKSIQICIFMWLKGYKRVGLFYLHVKCVKRGFNFSLRDFVI